jgi:hypothetical protein
LAIPEAKARTVGYYYFIRDTIVSLAGLLGGILWKINPSYNLWAAFGFGVLGTAISRFSAKGQSRGKGDYRLA